MQMTSRLLALLILTFCFLLGACGLPEYAVLDKPVPLSKPDVACLAFEAPSDVSKISGYVLFYKLYYSDSDFSTQNDSQAFNEVYYESSGGEMPPGDVVPRQRGFAKMGLVGGSEYPAFHILDGNLPSGKFFLDFNPGNPGNPMGDDSENPQVMLNSYPGGTPSGIHLARGVIDPTDIGNPDFLVFPNNWDWDNGSPADNYSDADLYRKLNLSEGPNVIDVVNSFKTGQPPSVQEGEKLIIGVAVCAYGYDPSLLTLLFSKPVFLGSVEYSPVHDITRVSNR